MVFIFVDESGIHKQTGYAVLALVYVPFEALAAVEAAVMEIEQGLGVAAFHWSDQRWKFRKRFLERVCTCEFSVKLAVCPNPPREAQWRERALQHLVVEKHIARVAIDGRSRVGTSGD